MAQIVQRPVCRLVVTVCRGVAVVTGRSRGNPGRTYYTYSNEPSQPVNKEPTWCKTAAEAVKCIKSGDTVFVQGAAATPVDLVTAMAEHGKKCGLKCVTVCHMHTEGPATYTDPEYYGIFRSLSFFMGANVRAAVNAGRSDVIPIFLHDIPRLFHHKIVKPNVALVHVSPPDKHGYCSLGTSLDCVRAALVHSKLIVACVNQCMPRTLGMSLIHYSHFDYAVQINKPIITHPEKPPSKEESKIGKLIAENLVENGANLQLGIGSIPDAVLSSLRNHKDLGIHSEMIAGGVIDLVESGCITNYNKTIHKGKMIVSFLIGPQRLYDYVHNNPIIEMHEVDYVNDVHIISKNPKMTAINSCIEVDITGQICSDSIGTRMFSGFGGQVDFIRGAAECFDGRGKPIIAMGSVTKNGASKIVPLLKLGAGVVTSRAHVHYVVTEWGVASLFGKSLRQRAYELIEITHPKHREELEKAAFDRLNVMPSK